MIIYQFSCHCDSRYVGRTFQRLQDRIKQHAPKSIRYGTSSPKRDLPIRKCKYSTKSATQVQSLTRIRPLDFTSYTIPLVLNTMMTACSPFSQKDVPHFIFQLLKPPSLKLPTLFSADKKNSFIT